MLQETRPTKRGGPDPKSNSGDLPQPVPAQGKRARSSGRMEGQENTVDLEITEENPDVTDANNDTEQDKQQTEENKKESHEESHHEKDKTTNASSNDRTEDQRSSSDLPKPWLSYAQAVFRSLQCQLNSADQTLHTLSPTLQQLRESQRKMKKVLEELNNLAAGAGTEQACLRPKTVKESVDKLKNEDRQKASEPQANKERSEQQAKQPMNEETGQGKLGEQAPAVQQSANSTEAAPTETPSTEASSTEALFSIVQNEFKCSICQELVVNASGLSCSHVFCKACIDEWLDKNKRCPVCRKGIKSKLHHVLSIDNFLQLYFAKFGTSEQRAERTRLISERRSREVITIEDNSPPTLNQYGASDLVYSIGFAFDGELPRTRNRNRRRRASESAIDRVLRLSRESAPIQREPVAGTNRPELSSITSRPRPSVAQQMAGNLSVLEPEVNSSEVITERRSERRTAERRTGTRRPTPIVRPLQERQTTATQYTQTLSRPMIEILPVIELDDANLEGLSSLDVEVDLIDLDGVVVTRMDDQSTSGGSGAVGRPDRSRPRNRGHEEVASNEGALVTSEPRLALDLRREENVRRRRRHRRRHLKRIERQERERRKRESRTGETSTRRAERLTNRTSVGLTTTSAPTTDQLATDTTLASASGPTSNETEGRALRGENATGSSSHRLRTSSARLSRNRSEDVRLRREERRRARRNRRLDISDYLLGRKPPN